MQLTAAETRPRIVEGAATFGVVDIGSNSVRLVVFDVSDGYPVPLYNESVSCGLGRGVGATGALPDDGVDCALAAITRFVRLAEDMDVAELEMVATAAIRDATNGAEFVAAVLSRTGRRVSVIDGAEEARLAGLGVAAAFREPRGLIGDLGCGSLELIRIDPTGLGQAVTLPVGALRVDAMFGGDLAKIEAHVAEQLAGVPWLAKGKGRTFYPVGGSWRALARIHMEQCGYPLHIVHAYTMDPDDMRALLEKIAGAGAKDLARMPGVPQKRIDMLPAAAVVLRRVLEAMQPKRISFSAAGLREGLVYQRLVRDGAADDPLLAAADAMGRREGRFGDVGGALLQWMTPIFLDRHKARDRLRYAACALSDIGWREHPDYRAEQAMLRVLRHPFLAVQHAERAFIAYAVYLRYGGAPEAPAVKPLISMMSKRAVRRAEVVGRALRLAYRISGGAIDGLADTRLQVDDGKVDLFIPAESSHPDRPAIQRQLKALAAAAGLSAGQVRP